ncbi:acyl carrier protein [Streptomyces sp. NPDC003860]
MTGEEVTNPQFIGVCTDSGGFTVIEQRIAEEIVRPLLGVVPERSDTSLIDLGATSLTLLQVFARVEETFDVELSLDDPLDQATVASLAASISAT